MDGLRRSGRSDILPQCLLTRAWLRFLTGPRTGSESTQEDLDEAWEIAERGPMKLFLADLHLHRARLFFRENEYPLKEAKNRKGEIVTNRTPKDDLDDATYLINDCGYHRRNEELADAEHASPPLERAKRRERRSITPRLLQLLHRDVPEPHFITVIL